MNQYTTDDDYTPQELEMIARIEGFLTEYPNAEWGPGHVVLSDYNLWISSIDFCLQECYAYLSGVSEVYGSPNQPYLANGITSRDDVVATIGFLLQLKEDYPND